MTILFKQGAAALILGASCALAGAQPASAPMSGSGTGMRAKTMDSSDMAASTPKRTRSMKKSTKGDPTMHNDRSSGSDTGGMKASGSASMAGGSMGNKMQTRPNSPPASSSGR